MPQEETSRSVSYEDACKITGRLFIESQLEITRLTEMVFALRKELADMQALLSGIKVKPNNGTGSERTINSENNGRVSEMQTAK